MYNWSFFRILFPFIITRIFQFFFFILRNRNSLISIINFHYFLLINRVFKKNIIVLQSCCPCSKLVIVRGQNFIHAGALGVLHSMDDFMMTISLLIDAVPDQEDEADVFGLDRSADLLGIGTASRCCAPR